MALTSIPPSQIQPNQAAHMRSGRTDWTEELQIEHATEAMWNLKLGTQRMVLRKLDGFVVPAPDLTGPLAPFNYIETEQVLMACIKKFDLVVVPREQHEAQEELAAAFHKQGPWPRDVGGILDAMHKIVRFFYARKLPLPDWLK